MLTLNSGLPTRRARWLEVRVRAWATARQWRDTLMRPGARVTTVAVAVYGAAALANDQKWPQASVWKSTAGETLLVVAGVLSILGYCLVTLSYTRVLRRQEANAQLGAACRSISRIIEATATIDHRQLGVHVWTVAGGRIAPHLFRRVRYVPEDRQMSAVTWVRGKGVIGLCWSKAESLVVNLAALRRQGPSETEFCALPPADRLNMTWAEFQQTRRYQAVCALPLRGGPDGARRFVGCISIDVRADGYFEALRDAVQANEDKIGRVLSVCEAVLGSTRR